MSDMKISQKDDEQFDMLMDKYAELLDIIDKHISSPRKEKLIELHKQFQDRILSAPASYKEHYHNAFFGGYLLHILNVIKHALDLYNQWSSWGVEMGDFGEEEIVFCALMHDFGKLGTEDEPFYIPETSDWHRKNLGRVYNINKNLEPYMETTSRTFFLLQKYDVALNETEYLGILLAEGMYNEIAHKNLLQPDDSKKLKTALPHIIHHADMSATVMEYLKWKREQQNVEEETSTTKKKQFKVKPNDLSKDRISDLKNLFDGVVNAKKTT